MYRFIAVLSLCICCCFGINTVYAGTSYTTGFETSEGYVVDETLYQQNGWSGGDWTGDEWNKHNDAEKVTDSVAHSGTNSWYFPGGPTTEGPGTPFSPTLDVSVGAPDYADYPIMNATIWFKPKNSNGDGSALNIYQGATDGSDRTGFNVYIDSTQDGINVMTYTTDGWTDIATNLSLDQWHSIDIHAVFSNDIGSDQITYTIDKGTSGEIASPVVNTWTHPWFLENQETYKPGDSLKFAWSRSAPDTAEGFYFDDISYEAVSAPPIPLPATLPMILLGGVLSGGFGWMRRRRG